MKVKYDGIFPREFRRNVGVALEDILRIVFNNYVYKLLEVLQRDVIVYNISLNYSDPWIKNFYYDALIMKCNNKERKLHAPKDGEV